MIPFVRRRYEGKGDQAAFGERRRRWRADFKRLLGDFLKGFFFSLIPRLRAIAMSVCRGGQGPWEMPSEDLVYRPWIKGKT